MWPNRDRRRGFLLILPRVRRRTSVLPGVIKEQMPSSTVTQPERAGAEVTLSGLRCSQPGQPDWTQCSQASPASERSHLYAL